MTTRFSPSTGCFYPIEIAYPILPEDLISVAEEEYNKALSRLPSQSFTVSADGLVTLITAPEVPESVVALALFRAEVTSAISEARGVALDYYMQGVPFPQPWVDYVSALRVLESAELPSPLPVRPVL